MKNLVCIFILFLVLVSCNTPEKQTTTSSLEVKLDSLVQSYLDSAKIAGVAIAVMKDNQPMLISHLTLRCP
jgi:uncharacterized protein YcfL